MKNLLCASLTTLLLSPLSADELQLKDGSTVVGKTRKVGKTYIVTTLDGVVRVPVDQVLRHRTDQELRHALTAFAMRSGAGSMHAQLELARLAERWGLDEEMWAYLGKALRAGRNSATLQRRCRDFMAGLEKQVLPKRWRDEKPAIKTRELLFRLRKNKVSRTRLAVIEELLTRLPEVDKDLRKRARRSSKPLQRVAAVRALARRPEKGNSTFVYRTAILDGHPLVRQEALAATKELGRQVKAIDYLEPGLLHDNGRYRIRTAEAYGELGDAAALPKLVAAGPKAGLVPRKALPGGATRGHMAVINQVSYIRDFEVEVAQASFIADPKIDVLHSGTVLDVTVLAVTTYRTEIVQAYRGAIKKLAGEDPGADPKAWAAWFKDYQGRQQLQANAARSR